MYGESQRSQSPHLRRGILHPPRDFDREFTYGKALSAALKPGPQHKEEDCAVAMDTYNDLGSTTKKMDKFEDRGSLTSND